MKTIATINFKGGVGKTTITWCLGDILSSYSDCNVLLFDLDAWLPDRVAIGCAITNRKTPTAFVEFFNRLWAEVEVILR